MSKAGKSLKSKMHKHKSLLLMITNLRKVNTDIIEKHANMAIDHHINITYVICFIYTVILNCSSQC
jgi:hypothetical protein